MSSVPTSATKTVCHCLNVTAGDIETSVNVLGCRTLHDVMQCTGAGTGCTACQRRLQTVINGAGVRPSVGTAVAAGCGR